MTNDLVVTETKAEPKSLISIRFISLDPIKKNLVRSKEIALIVSIQRLKMGKKSKRKSISDEDGTSIHKTKPATINNDNIINDTSSSKKKRKNIQNDMRNDSDNSTADVNNLDMKKKQSCDKDLVNDSPCDEQQEKQTKEESSKKKKHKKNPTHEVASLSNSSSGGSRSTNSSSATKAATTSKPESSKKSKGIDDIDTLFATKKEIEISQKKQEAEEEKRREQQRQFFRQNNNDNNNSATCIAASGINATNIDLKQDRSDVQRLQKGEWAKDGLGGVFDTDGFTGRKQDGTGYKIYKAHLFNKKGFGTTPDCPFDCKCCYI